MIYVVRTLLKRTYHRCRLNGRQRDGLSRRISGLAEGVSEFGKLRSHVSIASGRELLGEVSQATPRGVAHLYRGKSAAASATREFDESSSRRNDKTGGRRLHKVHETIDEFIRTRTSSTLDGKPCAEVRKSSKVFLCNCRAHVSSASMPRIFMTILVFVEPEIKLVHFEDMNNRR
jgi:hypothetical protein